MEEKFRFAVLTVVRSRFTRAFLSPFAPVRAQVVQTHNADAQDGGVGRRGAAERRARGAGAGGIIRDLKGRLPGERD